MRLIKASCLQTIVMSMRNSLCCHNSHKFIMFCRFQGEKLLLALGAAEILLSLFALNRALDDEVGWLLSAAVLCSPINAVIILEAINHKEIRKKFNSCVIDDKDLVL